MLSLNTIRKALPRTNQNLRAKDRNPVTVLIVEDIDIVRLGLKTALIGSPEFAVVGECGDGENAVIMACRLNPDLVLMDIGMPKMDGIQATIQIKEQTPKTKVIMFTSHEDDDEILAALGAGADGYCLKDMSFHDLRFALSTVVSGQRWIDSRLTRKVVELTGWKGQDSKQERQRLLDLELKIFRLMQKGVDIRTIADEIDLSVEQVEKVIGRVMEKLLDTVGMHQTAEPTKPPAFPGFAPEPQAGNSETSNRRMPAILRTEGAFAGRYHIDSVIGRGGMGIVYKATHLLMGRTVALKVLYPESASDLKAIAQFKKESQAASALRHQNIVSVYDFGVSDEGQPFLVMDYVNGVSLDKVLEHKNLELNRSIDIFLQVCDGLSVTHAQGLVHCDLKPSNIMIESNANGKDLVKIVDFGLAKSVPKNRSIQSKLTDSFEIVGSPLYMSPEQCSCSALDARSDIYSLGCIMYEAFCGQQIFDGKTPHKIFSQHLTDEPRPFAVVQPKRRIPLELESVVFKALKKDPYERYQSVLELKHDLRQVRAKLRVLEA